MAIPELDIEERSVKGKNTKENPKKGKRVSSAFLLSIFIFASLFQFFHLSPSTLFSDTKFWFFISNTIILIIAVDSGAFSSSKEKNDLYEEFLVNSRAKSASSFVEIGAKMEAESETETETLLVEKHVISPKSELAESGLAIVTQSDTEQKMLEFGQKGDTKAYCKHKKNEARCDCRKLEKSITVVTDENERILRRLETERREPRSVENEFSAMSNEELNKRVEEFIQKFNRQIRLQLIRESENEA